jgi:AraC-like DNA-binding protein
VTKKRQASPDGSVWIRTYPVTFLHDVTEQRRNLDWHQLTYAVSGHVEVITDTARWFVPADRGVWVPAGVAHAAVMRAPVSMRSIFVAAIPRTAAALRDAVPPPLTERLHAPARLRTREDRSGRVRTIAVSPLLRELIVHVTRIGALDTAFAEQAHLAAVLLDLIATADDVPLELPSPRDSRARAFAELVTAKPGDERSIRVLARKAGASVRTLERCFVAETGLGIGEWRRRVRLFHALHLLQTGAPVTEVALDVGYANSSAFGAAFRRQFGYSPGRRR